MSNSTFPWEWPISWREEDSEIPESPTDIEAVFDDDVKLTWTPSVDPHDEQRIYRAVENGYNE